MYTGFTQLEAYQLAEKLAHELFVITIQFPPSENRSLTDQIRRSSRSVCSNLAEGYAKRRYQKHFIAKMTDALGESYETETWLRFSRKCKYIDNEQYKSLHAQTTSINRLLTFMIRNPGKFADRYAKV